MVERRAARSTGSRLHYQPVPRIVRILLSSFVLALGGYVTWDRAEAYRLGRDIRAIAARGEPTDLSSLDRQPDAPEQQETAQLYVEAAARAREMAQQDSRLTRFDVDAVVGRIDVGELEESFRKDAPALQLLDRAASMPFGGFGDTEDRNFTVMGLQALNGLACLRSDLLAYRGDGDGAAASLVAAARVDRAVPELFFRYQLAIRQIGSLRILLRHSLPSTASLEALQQAFAEWPDDDGLERDLMLRRALLIEFQWQTGRPGGLSGVPVLLFHPFLLHNLRLQIEQFPEVMAAARTPWPDKLGALNALAESSSSRDGRTAFRRTVFGPPVNLAALSSSPTMAGLHLVARRLAMAALAIERHRRVNAGHPPGDLQTLVPAFLPAVPIDPFSGKPLVYRVSSGSYLLYSVDANRKDDGGELYGLGSLNPMPLPRARDFGVRVPLTPTRGAQ